MGTEFGKYRKEQVKFFEILSLVAKQSPDIFMSHSDLQGVVTWCQCIFKSILWILISTLNSTSACYVPAVRAVVPPLVAQGTLSIPSAGPAWSPAQSADKRGALKDILFLKVPEQKLKKKTPGTSGNF